MVVGYHHFRKPPYCYVIHPSLFSKKPWQEPPIPETAAASAPPWGELVDVAMLDHVDIMSNEKNPGLFRVYGGLCYQNKTIRDYI